MELLNHIGIAPGAGLWEHSEHVVVDAGADFVCIYTYVIFTYVTYNMSDV